MHNGENTHEKGLITMAHLFRTPTYSFIGEHALKDAASVLARLGKKALIVSGQSMIRQGHVALLEQLLDEGGVAYARFSEISGEPTDVMIDAGLAVYQAEGCDFAIGIGGGSALDSAKAISVCAATGERIVAFKGRAIDGEVPPVVCIPSTAGTGSEATKFTVITDTANNEKLLIGGDGLMPTLAIVDPLFSMQTPESITVATGMDALTHAIEAYTSRKAFPESDLFCLSAVKRIFSYLPVAVRDGSDAEARSAMAIAAYEAGIGIANSSVTVVHGMSRPIGALFHVPHGIANAMILQACLAYVVGGAEARFADLARAIGQAKDDDNDASAARAFLEAVAVLCEDCKVPTLESYGIDRARFFDCMDKMAVDALASGSPANTRMPLEKEDLLTIYRSLWQ